VFPGPVTLQQTLLWTAHLTALSVALQALELLQVRNSFADDGVFAWSELRRDYAQSPRLLQRALDGLLSASSFTLLLLIQLLLAVVLPWLVHPLWPALLFATVLLASVRFRGSYNGGSDAMTLVVLLGLSVARCQDASPAAPPWGALGLAYIAAQLVLSYWVAGLAKLRHASWRDGRALTSLVQVRQYVVPALLTRLLRAPSVARPMSWALIAFECAFPVTLMLGSRSAALMLALGAAFHLAIALGLGLNRFLWAWLSAYPALWFWSQRS
jgi:hypothetical protein